MTEAGAITARTAVVFLLATWPRRILLALLLLVPVIVGAVGGFGKAEPPPREVAPDVVTDTGAYLVVPRYYFVSDQVDTYGLADGERWVGAVAQITNQGTEPISVTFSDETFVLPDTVPNENSRFPYEVLRLDTGSSLSEAQPGLTYEVALLWRTTGLEDAPPELTLTMNRTWWTEWSIEEGYFTWRATADSYDVTLPLGELPDQIRQEEDE
ncbi:hypothetical protein [Pseudactinotalea sp.]|uniref:hypothetical protein n=1 Tax=Pseudactinotalea sp. TaxID=1926260 RepID=UPI003B3A9D00